MDQAVLTPGHPGDDAGSGPRRNAHNPGGQRQRDWHGRKDAATMPGALLLDEATARRLRTWAGDGLWHGGTARRADRDREPGEQRHNRSVDSALAPATGANGDDTGQHLRDPRLP